MAEESKRAKPHLEKEDRISDLPDSLIQHILYFLPSTNEAIRTSVLSKRWHNQWTHVPLLIFNDSGMSGENFSRFIDSTLLLHNCSKIHKLHIRSNVDYNADEDPHFNSKLRFAIEKDVKELILELKREFRLPNFLLNYASFVKLKLHSCIMPVGSVSWENLKVLNLEYSNFSEQAMQNILSGCLVLESLEINQCFGHDELVIASNSLKILAVHFDWTSFGEGISVFQISCGKLGELRLSGCYGIMEKVEFQDLSSSICAILDFDCDRYWRLRKLLEQFQHVEELNFGSNFIKLLSELDDEFEEYLEELFSLLLNNKSLILDSPNFGEHSEGIAIAFRMSHMLENLVIKDPVLKISNLSNDFWNISGEALDFSMSHLKTVHITGVSKRNDKCELQLDFIRLILRNARSLEKLVIVKDDGKTFSMCGKIKMERVQFNSIDFK